MKEPEIYQRKRTGLPFNITEPNDSLPLRRRRPAPRFLGGMVRSSTAGIEVGRAYGERARITERQAVELRGSAFNFSITPTF